jgi:hypothetical protein
VEFRRLCDRAVDTIVKGACRAAAHSLRAGHVTEARGASRASVKRQTGHTGDAMMGRYDRGDDLENSSLSLGL